jgi:hypothetical protein
VKSFNCSLRRHEKNPRFQQGLENAEIISTSLGGNEEEPRKSIFNATQPIFYEISAVISINIDI